MTSPSEPRLLLIETSGDVGMVGLGQGGTLAQQAILASARRHARDLVMQCQSLCQKQQWNPADLDLIAVDAGPGSYTGLRVGVMTAKTLAYALNKPLAGIPAFDAIAWNCFRIHPDMQELEVIADAQQDRVYVQCFARSGESPGPLTIRKGGDWRNARNRQCPLTGPGVPQQQPRLPADAVILDESLWRPTLESLLHLAMVRWDAGEFDDPFTLEPLYLRASSAEEQWSARSATDT